MPHWHAALRHRRPTERHTAGRPPQPAGPAGMKEVAHPLLV